MPEIYDLSSNINTKTMTVDFSKYDKTIKVGDIVTSSFDGYWEVTHIEIREPYRDGTLCSPLISGKNIMKSDGTLINEGRFSWDASYSQKVTEEFIREQYNHEVILCDIKRDNLLKLLSCT